MWIDETLRPVLNYTSLPCAKLNLTHFIFSFLSWVQVKIGSHNFNLLPFIFFLFLLLMLTFRIMKGCHFPHKDGVAGLKRLKTIVPY